MSDAPFGFNGTVLDGMVQALRQNGENPGMSLEDMVNHRSSPSSEVEVIDIDSVEGEEAQNDAVENESVKQDEQEEAVVQDDLLPRVRVKTERMIETARPAHNGPTDTVRPAQNGPVETTLNAISVVNGQGMWRAWKRNFKSSLMAVLDLFDNAIDASLVTTEEAFHFRGRGKIHVFADNSHGGATTGICMVNNCHSRIPPMREVLEIFRSNKCSQDIGENGVGIKQACASLTDISFVITRNGKELNVGVIAAALQRNEGCVLPFITLNSEMEKEDLSDCVMENSEFAKCVELYGDGHLGRGLERLWERCKTVCTGCWTADHYVFCVLLHKLRHGASSSRDDSSEGDDDIELDYALSAENLMNKLADTLPERYIHIPADFDIRVNHHKIKFQYWERRLVDLTSFACKIDPKRDFVGSPDWRNPTNGYNLRIYCGFDPNRSNKVLSLYVYSRHSGRLICCEEDARNTLGLSNSGTDFAQGLTIIIDDYMSNLPLTPTKQGLGFAEETTDGVHEKNLYAWTGAHAHLYYQYHKNKFGLKGSLRDGVASCLPAVQRLHDRDDVESFMRGKFTEFKGLNFSNFRNKSIRVSSKKYEVVRGPDSRVNLTPPAIPASGRKKRPSLDSNVSSPFFTPNSLRTHVQAPAFTNIPAHQLMAATPRPVACSRRTPTATQVSQANTSIPVTQDGYDGGPASPFSDESADAASAPNFHIPQKKARVEEPAPHSVVHTDAEQDHERLGPRGEKYKAMYEQLQEKFKASKLKNKEKVARLKESLAASTDAVRKKDEALQQLEDKLGRKQEDLSLAEEMKANLKRDIATLEKQNAMLAARLERQSSTIINI